MNVKFDKGLQRAGLAKGLPVGVPGGRIQDVINLKRSLYDRFGILSTQGVLRIDYVFTDAQISEITYNPNANSANQAVNIPTSNLLDQNDTFTIMSSAAYLSKIPSTALNTPLTNDYAKAELRTFPNALVFSNTNEAVTLQAFYNSIMSLNLDQTILIRGIYMKQFYRVFTSQQLVGPTAAANKIPADEWPESMAGKVQLQPTVEINGSKQTLFSQKFKQASYNFSPGAGGSGTNMASLFLFGLLHQGASSRQEKVQELINKLMQSPASAKQIMSEMFED